MSENMDSAGRKSRLKQLLDLGTEIRKNNGVEDNEIIEKISNIIKETDNMNRIGDIQDRAHNTTEVVMDAQVVQMSHELIGEVMQKLGTTEFAEEEWINTLVAIVYKNDNADWNQIGEIAASINKMFKFSPCLLDGSDFTAESEEKIAKERQKRTKNTKAEEVKPENLSQIEKRDGNKQNMVATYKQILEICIANNEQPIPYYKLIIDPDNFMNSVDNAFKVAFLARDKSVKISSGSDGFPVVRPSTKAEKANSTNETTQAICTLDMKIAKEMIKKYKIKKPLLKRV